MRVRGIFATSAIAIATVCSVAVSFLAFTDPPEAAAFATSFLLLGTALALLARRPNPLDARFVFLVLFCVYYVAMPVAYVSGTAQVPGAGFLAGQWSLLTRGNLIAEAGILAFGVGLWAAGRITRRRPRIVAAGLRTADGRRLVLVLLVVGIISFFVMWLREGHPLGVFVGHPPQGRARLASDTAGGYGYFLELTFCVNLALFAHAMVHPRRTLWAPTTLALFAGSFVADSLLGSRLLLVMTWIGVILIRQRAAGGSRDGSAADGAIGRIRWMPVIVTASVLFALATGYTSYRIGESPTRTSLETTALSTFDTSTAYFVVLQDVPSQHPFWRYRTLATPVLQLIPSNLYPGKYNAMYSDARFTLEFYGYDQNRNGTVARGADLLAEAYLNGGVLGVVVIMAALGLLCETMTAAMRRRPASSPFLIAYIVFLLFYIPFAEKDGAISGITFVDVKIAAFAAASFVVTRAVVHRHARHSRRPA